MFQYWILTCITHCDACINHSEGSSPEGVRHGTHADVTVTGTSANFVYVYSGNTSIVNTPKRVPTKTAKLSGSKLATYSSPECINNSIIITYDSNNDDAYHKDEVRI